MILPLVSFLFTACRDDEFVAEFPYCRDGTILSTFTDAEELEPIIKKALNIEYNKVRAKRTIFHKKRHSCVSFLIVVRLMG